LDALDVLQVELPGEVVEGVEDEQVLVGLGPGAHCLGTRRLGRPGEESDKADCEKDVAHDVLHSAEKSQVCGVPPAGAPVGADAHASGGGGGRLVVMGLLTGGGGGVPRRIGGGLAGLSGGWPVDPGGDLPAPPATY